MVNQGKKALSSANIDGFMIKNKHLSSSGGNWNKFNIPTEIEAKTLVKKIINDGKIVSIKDNGFGSAGQQSYKIIIDAGKSIGTNGESLVRIIIDDLGNVWTIFPE